MKILIINGPNLNLLGQREPEIYGRKPFEEYLVTLQMEFPQATIHYFQSNHEGDLIDKIQEAGALYQGVVINPGAYGHTSYALADAIAAVEIPVVEVHISNVFARETFRHTSVLAPHCVGSIIGLGLRGYHLAVEYLLE